MSMIGPLDGFQDSKLTKYEIEEVMNSTLKYPYTVEKQEDGSYFVQFVDLPDVFTEGWTPEEATFMAQDVLTLMVDAYTEDGKELPTPSPVGDLPFAIVEESIDP